MNMNIFLLFKKFQKFALWCKMSETNKQTQKIEGVNIEYIFRNHLKTENMHEHDQNVSKIHFFLNYSFWAIFGK